MKKTKTGLTIVTQNGDELVISNQKVMQSAAGYYVGCGYTEELFLGDGQCMEDVTEDMLGLPYSRDSGYFATRSEAEAYLAYINN